MKKLLIPTILVLIFSTTSFAQQFAAPDKSPMDMAYHPHNFGHDRKAGEQAVIRVIYSRPAKNGREIFGKQTPFGKVWRTGANEATEIKFYQDVEFADRVGQIQRLADDHPQRFVRKISLERAAIDLDVARARS